MRVFNFFRGFKQKSEEEDNQTIRRVNDQEIIYWIQKTADCFRDQKEFSQTALLAAQSLEESCIKRLPEYFHSEAINMPGWIKHDFHAMTQWIHILQDTIFEILYCYRQAAVSTLYKIAFGEYDWTQDKAIRVLCKFANEGITPERIVNDIESHLDDFRYEALMPSLYYLSRLPADLGMAATLEKYYQLFLRTDPIDAFTVLSFLAFRFPQVAAVHLSFLKSLAKGSGIEDRHPLQDGAVCSVDSAGNEEVTWLDREPVDEEHQIKAALLFYQLNTDDSEINGMLWNWMTNHPDESVRNKLKEQLGNQIVS